MRPRISSFGTWRWTIKSHAQRPERTTSTTCNCYAAIATGRRGTVHRSTCWHGLLRSWARQRYGAPESKLSGSVRGEDGDVGREGEGVGGAGHPRPHRSNSLGGANRLFQPLTALVRLRHHCCRRLCCAIIGETTVASGKKAPRGRRSTRAIGEPRDNRNRRGRASREDWGLCYSRCSGRTVSDQAGHFCRNLRAGLRIFPMYQLPLLVLIGNQALDPLCKHVDQLLIRS